MRTLERGEQPAQRLLFPMTLHLGPAESDAFERNRDVVRATRLRDRGIRRPHADRARRADAASALRSRAVPARDAGGAHGRPRERARMRATSGSPRRSRARRRSRPATRCRPARCARSSSRLRDTTLPAHDVHGRATIVQLTWDEIERRFGRSLTLGRRVICGPTAGGKSAIAMWLAERAADRDRQRRFASGVSRLRHRHREADRRTSGRASRTRASTSSSRPIAIRRRRGRTPRTTGSTTRSRWAARRSSSAARDSILRALFEGLFDEPPIDVEQRRRLEPRARRAADVDELQRWVERARSGARAPRTHAAAARRSRSRCSRAGA